MLFFKSKNKEVLDKGQRGYYDVRLYEQLADNLLYAGEDCLFSDKGVSVYARECKQALYKITLVDSIEEYKSLDLSNEKLFELNMETEFRNNFNLSSLKLTRQIHLVIFKHKTTESVEYATKHLSFDGNILALAMVYNDKKVTLDYYRYLPDYHNIMKDYNNMMYFDLAAKDKEME